MTVCIISRYVHRNKKEAWLYVTDVKIYFLATLEKYLRRAPPWQIPGYAPDPNFQKSPCMPFSSFPSPLQFPHPLFPSHFPYFPIISKTKSKT